MKYDIFKYQRIRDLREDKDLTQAEVARHINVGRDTYSRYETSMRNIPLEVMSALADFHGTSVDYLMGRTNEMKPYPPA